MKDKARIAIFASGNGSNLEAILKAVKAGRVPAQVAFCFSDNPASKALERAKKLGFQTLQLSPKDFPDKKAYESVLTEKLRSAKVDWVILAGYMRLLGPDFVQMFAKRIINIHPALLPSFKGTHGIRDAWNYGVRFTGVTVHFVTDDMDGGPIISQTVVPVRMNDSLLRLEKRIHQEEHKLYPASIRKLLTQKFKIEGRKVIFSALSSRA